MLDIKFIDDDVYPIKASESSDNAFYLNGCIATANARPNYAVCLAKCKARQNGTLDDRYSDCSNAIGSSKCPALKMRSEEVCKGRALYFISRPRLLAFNEYRSRMERAAWNHLNTTGKRSSKSEDFAIEHLPDDAGSFNAALIKPFQSERRLNSGVGSYEPDMSQENTPSEGREEVAVRFTHQPQDEDYGDALARLVTSETQKQGNDDEK